VRDLHRPVQRGLALPTRRAGHRLVGALTATRVGMSAVPAGTALLVAGLSPAAAAAPAAATAPATAPASA
jgi:hypothetical protein